MCLSEDRLLLVVIFFFGLYIFVKSVNDVIYGSMFIFNKHLIAISMCLNSIYVCILSMELRLSQLVKVMVQTY